MFADEIEFIIAKAKLDAELKFNEDQPRDEHGRFTDGSGFSGAASFVNPRDDKDVQRYLELKKIVNGPYISYGEPGYEEHRAAVSEYRNMPKHIVDRAKLSINLENKAQSVADGFASQELGLTAEDVENQITTELQEFVNENPVAVQIPVSRLDSVLDNGLQSMYESGTRGGKRGAEYQEIRADSEAALFGYNDEKTPTEQRPVYGFVARPETSLQWDSVGGYGNTTVILKDSIRDNTTVTVDDSLEMSYTYGDIFPTPINNVTIDSVTTARADIFVRERDIPFADRPFTYVEAQIHGGVEASDIERVILPKEPTKALAAKMDGMGITYTVKEQTKAFDPSQERDENGRWTDGGGSVEITSDAIDKEIAKGSPGAHQSLKAVIRLRNFDAQPQIVSSNAELTGIKMYRGVHSDDFTEAPQMVEQFKTGEMYVGQGIFGNGVYFASDLSLASKYAYGVDGSLAGQGAMITGALSSDAKILEMSQEDDAADMKLIQELSDAIPREVFANHVVGRSDPSLIAALNGYDAIHIGDAENGDQYIILNRGAMQVVA